MIRDVADRSAVAAARPRRLPARRPGRGGPGRRSRWCSSARRSASSTAATCTRACTSMPIAAKPAAIPTKLEVDVQRAGHRRRAPRQRPQAGRRACASLLDAEGGAGLGRRADGREGRRGRGGAPVEGAAARPRARRRRGRLPAAAATRARRRPAARTSKKGGRRRRGQVAASQSLGRTSGGVADAPRGRARQSGTAVRGQPPQPRVHGGRRAGAAGPARRPPRAKFGAELAEATRRGRARPALQAHGVHERQRPGGGAGGRLLEGRRSPTPSSCYDELDLPVRAPQARRRAAATAGTTASAR